MRIACRPKSRLIQPRGLKCEEKVIVYFHNRRGLYSLVDWNIYDTEKLIPKIVEAYTASWIEILRRHEHTNRSRSRLIQPRGLKYRSREQIHGRIRRGLYSLVDWNTCRVILFSIFKLSRLIQPRGLKYTHLLCILKAETVEAYTASWIEIYGACKGGRSVWSRLIQPRGLKWLRHWPINRTAPSRLIQPRGLK